MNAVRWDEPRNARQYAFLPDPFRMHNGGALLGARIAYETWGSLNAARDNAILLFTGLSPSPHAASSLLDPSDGWWEGMIGPGKAIDTQRWFVICVNSLGSCFGSTGPASQNPIDATPYRLRFPELAVEDIARAGHETLRTLGIERLAAVVGPSLGGMVVLAFAAQFPGVARRLVSISGTMAASPVAIALRSVQREAVVRDPEWKGGEYAFEQPPRNGLTIARKLGTITYRSAAEWNDRFGRIPASVARSAAGPFAPRFAIESYLEAQAEKFVRAFDANSYLYLSRAMDRFDLAAHGTPAQLFKRAALDAALVIGVDTDMLFPVTEQAAIARHLERAGVATTLLQAKSREGHDAFLIDLETFGKAIGEFLNAR